MRKVAKKPETKVLPVYLPKEMWRLLKIVSAETDKTMNDLCREGIDHILKKYMLKPH